MGNNKSTFFNPNLTAGNNNFDQFGSPRNNAQDEPRQKFDDIQGNFLKLEENKLERVQRSRALARGDKIWEAKGMCDSTALNSFKQSITILKGMSSSVKDKVNEKLKMTCPR